MDKFQFYRTYVGKVHVRVEGQKQLDYLCMSFFRRFGQSSPFIFTLGIDVEVTDLGLYLDKITPFDSSVKCVIVRHLRK